MAKKWIAGAIQRPGALTAKAKAAGESIGQFCSHQHTGTTAKQCNLAKTLKALRGGNK